MPSARRLAALLTLLLLPACASTEPIGPANPEPGDEAAASPDPALIEAALGVHRDRVARIPTFFSSGVLELRWRDADGDEHFEPQVNARIWLDPPRKSALRAEKLGEEIFWLGSDDETVWLFDLFSDPATVYLANHDQTLATGPSEAPLLIRPASLIDLLGLWPVAAGAEPTARVESARLEDRDVDVYVIEGRGRGGPVRIWLEPTNGWPLRVEVLDEATGEVILHSTLDRYEGATVENLSSLGWPRVPTLINIADREGRIRLRLALADPAVDAPNQPWGVVFDFDRLLGSLRPDETKDLRPDQR